jgi:hypothetical protein
VKAVDRSVLSTGNTFPALLLTANLFPVNTKTISLQAYVQTTQTTANLT